MEIIGALAVSAPVYLLPFWSTRIVDLRAVVVPDSAVNMMHLRCYWLYHGRENLIRRLSFTHATGWLQITTKKGTQVR